MKRNELVTSSFLQTVVLCGGLNINVFKKQYRHAKLGKRWKLNLAVRFKSNGFFKHSGAKVAAQVSGLGDSPSLEDLIGSVGVMLKKYDEGELDRLYVVFNKFVNTMVQQPTIDQLLPLPKSDSEEMQRAFMGLHL